MWQYDFFSKKMVSNTGLRDVFVLVFLHVDTRRVYICPATYKPSQAWMVEQAKAFIRHTKWERLPRTIQMHDTDEKYLQPFLNVLANRKINTQRNAIRSPNSVAFVERLIQSIKQECLDHFIVFGEACMSLIFGSEFGKHYPLGRPHQGPDYERFQLPTQKKRGSLKVKFEAIRLNELRCLEGLSGLLGSHSRRAA